jgi:RES domain-containing protein
LAYLEILAHFVSEEAMAELLLFEIEIPDSLIKPVGHVPVGWNRRPAAPVSQRLGDRWLRARASVALRVPSVIVPSEWNVLINPVHPEFKLDWVKNPKSFSHDSRLISRSIRKT